MNSRISSNGKKWSPLWFWKRHMQNPLCLNLSYQSLLNLEDKPLAAVIFPHHPQSGNEMRTLPTYNSNGLLDFPVCSKGSMNPPLLWNTHSSFLWYHLLSPEVRFVGNLTFNLQSKDAHHLHFIQEAVSVVESSCLKVSYHTYCH